MIIDYARIVKKMIPYYYRIIEIQHQLVVSNPAGTDYCSFPSGVRVGCVLLYT